jgi:hypothetical protein
MISYFEKDEISLVGTDSQFMLIIHGKMKGPFNAEAVPGMIKTLKKSDDSNEK